MIRVELVGQTLASQAPREVFRDLWVEVPNYANPKARGTVHACFCGNRTRGRGSDDKARSFLVPYAWALRKQWCPPGHCSADPKGSSASSTRGYAFKGTLDPSRFQDRAIEGVYRAFREKNAALLCMPCGFGKTVTALAILAGMPGRNVRMLVFAHKTFLLDQWEERAGAFLSVKEEEGGAAASHRPVAVGRYQGPKSDCDWSKYDIICASLATVARRLADRDPTAASLMRGSSNPEDALLVVYDEAHHVPATTWLRTFFSLRARPGLRVLGLSATPRRTDGLDAFLGSCFGLPFVAPVEDARKRQRQRAPRRPVRDGAVPAARVTLVKHPFGPPRMPLSRRTGKPDFNAFLQAIVTSKAVSDLIAKEAAAQLRDPLTTSVLILSHRVSHLREIVTRLPKGTARALYGGQTRAEKAEGHKFKCRVVASTYAYLSEGFDCKKFNVLILATPKKDVEQAIGRIARDRGARWRAMRDAVAAADSLCDGRLQRDMYCNEAASTARAPEMIASLAVNTKSLVVDIAQGSYALRQRRSTYADRGLHVRVRNV